MSSNTSNNIYPVTLFESIYPETTGYTIGDFVLMVEDSQQCCESWDKTEPLIKITQNDRLLSWETKMQCEESQGMEKSTLFFILHLASGNDAVFTVWCLHNGYYSHRASLMCKNQLLEVHML